MNIQVKFHRLFNNESSNLLGIASVILDDSLAVHGIKIMENVYGGKFVAMPSAKSKKGARGQYYDIVHPITSEFRRELNEAIMQEYKSVLKKYAQKAEADNEPLPEQLEIPENNVPYRASDDPVTTLFDALPEAMPD